MRTTGDHRTKKRIGDGAALTVRLTGSTALGLVFALAVQPAAAAEQGAAAPAASYQVAQAADEAAFNIPAQALDAAVTAFGRQSGWQVSVDQSVLAGRASPGVVGRMAPRDALQRLLAGTGVTWRMSDPKTVLLLKAPQSSDAMTLDPVTVEGAKESAWGPVRGYVATRSAAGTKTDTPLVETPQSVSVVTRDQLEARGARNMGQALAYTAGAATGRRGESSSFGGDNVTIRGFGGTGTAGASSNEYVDGLRLMGTNYVTSGFDTYLYERIDVLKGPASVLYGQGQPGGVVNAASRRPQATPGGEIVGQIGSHEHLQGAFDVTGPLDAEGTLLYRLTGLGLDSDAQTNFMQRRRVAVAPAFTWRPTADTSLTLLASYQRDDITGSPLNYVPAYGSVLANPNGEIARDLSTGEPTFDDWRRTSKSIGYLFEHRFDDTWTVRQNARYLHNDLTFKTVYPTALAANGRTLSRSAFTAQEGSDAVAIDNQAQAKFATGPLRHTVLAGLDYGRVRSDTLRGLAAAPTLDMYAPSYGRRIADPPIYQSIASRTSQTGVYLQDQIKAGGWNLLLGGRRDWAQSKSRNRLTGVTQSQQDQAFTGRAGLLYLFDNGFAPYVSYAESFEPTSGSDYSGNAFVPTTGQQYEAGVKFQPSGWNSFVTVSLFNLTQQNVTTTDPAHAGFSVQTGEIRSRGVEIEGKASLAQGLDVLAAFTYLDAEVTKSNGTDRGKTPTAIPTHQASLWANYTFQDGALRGLGLGAGVRYVGATWGDSTNTFKVPSYTLADAAAQYDLSVLSAKLEGVKLAVTASNLFDKTFVGSCIRLTSCYYGEGRVVIGSLKYQW